MNPQPTRYKCVALPIELCQQKRGVGPLKTQEVVAPSIITPELNRKLENRTRRFLFVKGVGLEPTRSCRSRARLNLQTGIFRPLALPIRVPFHIIELLVFPSRQHLISRGTKEKFNHGYLTVLGVDLAQAVI